MFISAGGFEALVAASEDVYVGDVQCEANKDVSDGLYVDLEFNLKEDCEGMSFGQVGSRRVGTGELGTEGEEKAFDEVTSFGSTYASASVIRADFSVAKEKDEAVKTYPPDLGRARALGNEDCEEIEAFEELGFFSRLFSCFARPHSPPLCSSDVLFCWMFSNDTPEATSDENPTPCPLDVSGGDPCHAVGPAKADGAFECSTNISMISTSPNSTTDGDAARHELAESVNATLPAEIVSTPAPSLILKPNAEVDVARMMPALQVGAALEKAMRPARDTEETLSNRHVEDHGDLTMDEFGLTEVAVDTKNKPNLTLQLRGSFDKNQLEDYSEKGEIDDRSWAAFDDPIIHNEQTHRHGTEGRAEESAEHSTTVDDNSLEPSSYNNSDKRQGGCKTSPNPLVAAVAKAESRTQEISDDLYGSFGGHSYTCMAEMLLDSSPLSQMSRGSDEMSLDDRSSDNAAVHRAPSKNDIPQAVPLYGEPINPAS